MRDTDTIKKISNQYKYTRLIDGIVEQTPDLLVLSEQPEVDIDVYVDGKVIHVGESSYIDVVSFDEEEEIIDNDISVFTEDLFNREFDYVDANFNLTVDNPPWEEGLEDSNRLVNGCKVFNNGDIENIDVTVDGNEITDCYYNHTLKSGTVLSLVDYDVTLKHLTKAKELNIKVNNPKVGLTINVEAL